MDLSTQESYPTVNLYVLPPRNPVYIDYLLADRGISCDWSRDYRSPRYNFADVSTDLSLRRRWIQGYPSSFVLNSYYAPPGKYVIFESNDCPYVTGRVKRFTSQDALVYSGQGHMVCVPARFPKYRSLINLYLELPPTDVCFKFKMLARQPAYVTQRTGERSYTIAFLYDKKQNLPPTLYRIEFKDRKLSPHRYKFTTGMFFNIEVKIKSSEMQPPTSPSTAFSSTTPPPTPIIPTPPPSTKPTLPLPKSGLHRYKFTKGMLLNIKVKIKSSEMQPPSTASLTLSKNTTPPPTPKIPTPPPSNTPRLPLPKTPTPMSPEALTPKTPTPPPTVPSTLPPKTPTPPPTVPSTPPPKTPTPPTTVPSTPPPKTPTPPPTVPSTPPPKTPTPPPTVPSTPPPKTPTPPPTVPSTPPPKTPTPPASPLAPPTPSPPKTPTPQPPKAPTANSPNAAHKLPTLKIGEEVLARWGDDRRYYRGVVVSVLDNNTWYKVKDNRGRFEKVERENIIRIPDLCGSSATAGNCNDNKCIVARHRNYMWSYAPGHVIDNRGDYMTIKFYDDVIIPNLKSSHVYPANSSDKHRDDIEAIRERERDWEYKNAVIRDDDTGYYELGTVLKQIGKNQTYEVKFPNGMRRQQKSVHIFGEFSGTDVFKAKDYILAVIDRDLVRFLPGQVESVDGCNKLTVTFVNNERRSNVEVKESFWLHKTYYEEARDLYRQKQN